VVVERFNLSQEPAAFVGNPDVVAAMRGRDDALPLLLLDGTIVMQGGYPERAALAGLVGVALPKTPYSEAVAEQDSIGAAIASNCEPCFRFHFDKARKLGVSKEDVARAVTTAKMVKESPARAVVALAEKVQRGAACSGACSWVQRCSGAGHPWLASTEFDPFPSSRPRCRDRDDLKFIAWYPVFRHAALSGTASRFTAETRSPCVSQIAAAPTRAVAAATVRATHPPSGTTVHAALRRLVWSDGGLLRQNPRFREGLHALPSELRRPVR
jgi:AhpD family alkylhydroperoxidase